MLPLEQLHPIAVHFPIVFMLTLAALDVIIVMRGFDLSGNGTAATSSAGLAALAAVGALVAFYLGDAALDIAVAAKAPAAPLEIHANLGTVTAWAIVVWGALRGLAWWKQIPITGNRRLLVIGVEIVLAGMIITTAYFGGALVFDYGIAVNPTGG